jgi:hypothetical protein
VEVQVLPDTAAAHAAVLVLDAKLSVGVAVRPAPE